MSVKKKAVIFVALGLGLIILDQVSKAIVLSAHAAGSFSYCKLIPGLFSFAFVKNTGAAWGIFQDSTLALSIFSLVVIAFLILYIFVFNKKANNFLFYGSILICAGGLGNIIDRLARGFVVDFIKFDFINFPVFNVADSCVTIGFCLALIGLFLEFKAEAQASKKKKENDKKDKNV